MVSLSAKGLTTGETSALFTEVYGADVSKDTISEATHKVQAEMTEWQNRPLDARRLLANAGDPADLLRDRRHRRR